MHKTIAVAIGKGGMGKTTTAVNLAACLAIAEKKTLLIDFDAAASCSDYLGFTRDKAVDGIFKVFSFAKSISHVIRKTDLEYLDVIPSDISSPDIEERLMRLTSYVFIFKNILNSPELYTYDYVVIDCPPSLKGLTTIALTSANSILIPVKAGNLSLFALEKMLDFITWIRRLYNSQLKVEGVLRTMYEADTRAWNKTNDELLKCCNDILLDIVIPKNTHLVDAEFYHKPAVLYNLKSRGSQAYLQLANRILNHNRLQSAANVRQASGTS